MTNHTVPPSGEREELQFDHAEYATEHPPGLACGFCKQPIADSYFELNRNLLCGPCRERVMVATTGGSKLVRFLRACLLGGFAALAGASLYFLVLAVTGYEVGLIAILVGFMVGKAVSTGARHRGGLIYQLLAVFLTYTAIVSAYMPMIWKGLAAQHLKPRAAVAAAEVPIPVGQPAGVAPAIDPATKDAKPDDPPHTPKQAGDPQPGLVKTKNVPRGVVLFARGVATVVVAYLFPFLQGFQNVIGLFIIFFGLMQAWQLNRKVRLTINGPYQVAGEGPALENAVHA